MPSLRSVEPSEGSVGDRDVDLGGRGSSVSSAWFHSIGEFEKDVDQSFPLESVECDIGETLLEFSDDVVVRRDGGLELLCQVAARSAGPPGEVGLSLGNPICLE